MNNPIEGAAKCRAASGTKQQTKALLANIGFEFMLARQPCKVFGIDSGIV